MAKIKLESHVEFGAKWDLGLGPPGHYYINIPIQNIEFRERISPAWILKNGSQGSSKWDSVRYQVELVLQS